MAGVLAIVVGDKLYFPRAFPYAVVASQESSTMPFRFYGRSQFFCLFLVSTVLEEKLGVFLNLFKFKFRL